MKAKIRDWLQDEGAKKKPDRKSMEMVLAIDFDSRRKKVAELQERNPQNDQFLQEFIEEYPIFNNHEYVC